MTATCSKSIHGTLLNKSKKKLLFEIQIHFLWMIEAEKEHPARNQSGERETQQIESYHSSQHEKKYTS